MNGALRAELAKHAEQICKVGKRIYDRGLVSAFGGNISTRVGDAVLITATGSILGELTMQDIVEVSMDGEIMSKGKKPSSELLMHLEVYRTRKDARAVVHTHSPVAVSYAVVGKEIEPLTPEAKMALGSVPLIKYYPSGSQELANATAQSLEKYKDRNSFLLGKHGVLAVGEDLVEAFHRAELVEELAKVNFYVETLNHGLGR